MTITKPPKKYPQTPWMETRRRAKRIAKRLKMTTAEVFDAAVRSYEEPEMDAKLKHLVNRVSP